MSGRSPGCIGFSAARALQLPRRGSRVLCDIPEPCAVDARSDISARIRRNCGHTRAASILDSRGRGPAAFEQRSALIDHLGRNDILAVSHYISLHSSPYYIKNHDGRVLNNSDHFTKKLLRLPFYYELNVLGDFYPLKFQYN